MPSRAAVSDPWPVSMMTGIVGVHFFEYLQDLNSVHIFHFKIQNGAVEANDAKSLNGFVSIRGGDRNDISFGHSLGEYA
jgi:hypothetical protein